MWEDAVQAIMQGDFLLGLFGILMAVLVSIVNLILLPFSLIIQTLLPDLSGALEVIADYFDIVGTYLAWVLNAIAIPSLAIVVLVTYYLFAYSTTFTVWIVKLIIKWKQAIWG